MTKVWTSPAGAPRPSGPQAYGRAFDAAFQRATAAMGPGEVGLFRELADSLRAAAGGFRVEEYHGGAHQVRFVGDGKHSRIDARCELSDLLIIVFSPSAGAARFTFLQAKSERAVPPNPPQWAYEANLEQWDLLAQRPDIQPVSKAFTAPKNLLSGALMPSIGSFGLFYQTGSSGYQLLYASADCLAPSIVHAVRRGRLKPQGASFLRPINGFSERTLTWGNYYFARDLYGLKIGEPLLSNGQVVQSPGARWMAGILSGFSTMSLGPGSNRPLVDALARALGGQDGERRDPIFGAKRMVVIESQEDATFSESVG